MTEESGPLITKIAPKIRNKFSIVICHEKVVACFKLSSLAKRPRPPSQFLEFIWAEVRKEAQLGCGTFWICFLCEI